MQQQQQQQRVALPAHLAVPPPVAWPTVALFAVATAAFVATHVFYHVVAADSAEEQRQWYPLALLLWCAAGYANFTVAHDATHGAIASSSSARSRSVGVVRWRRWLLNDVLGWVAGLTFGVPFNGLKVLHLMHHRHTNVIGKDPDLWGSPVCLSPSAAVRAVHLALTPLRQLSLELGYLAHYAPLVARGERPAREVAAMVVVLSATLVYPWASLLAHGWDRAPAFTTYYLPAALVHGLLALVFDYIPHRPHDTVDLHRGTNITAFWVAGQSGAKGADKRRYGMGWLTSLMLYQNYHAIHHLYPWIPFYRYAAVWRAMEPVLRDQRGVPVRPLWPVLLLPQGGWHEWRALLPAAPAPAASRE